MAKVSIIKAEDDLYEALNRAIDGIGERPIARGDHVLIKPNLVEPRDPGSGAITTPGLIEAVARYCLDYGAAKVIIGEGPSYYQPESRLRECFTNTGVTEVAERLGIDWVLFDEHGYRTFREISDRTDGLGLRFGQRGVIHEQQIKGLRGEKSPELTGCLGHRDQDIGLFQQCADAQR